MLSGGFTDWAAISMEESEKLYTDTIRNVGCEHDLDCLKPGPVCDCLQNMDGERLVNLQPDGGWGPTVDGVKLPLHPRQAIKKGAVHQHIPIIIGGAFEDSLVDVGAGAD